MPAPWVEIGDRVFVRRYPFLEQNVTVVLGGDAALVVDTRSTIVQAREVLDDLRTLGSPRVAVAVNTHGHWDHAFGNATFRPTVIWGHERSIRMLRLTGEAQRARGALENPEVAADLADVVVDPPDRTFTDRATVDVDDREVVLTYLGRGHTDNDAFVTVPDADVLCVGDLISNWSAPPWFGDGYPLEWPATVEAALGLISGRTVVVPGHGQQAGRALVERSILELRAIADLATRVHAGTATFEEAVASAPYEPVYATPALERALVQLRGELEEPATV